MTTTENVKATKPRKKAAEPPPPVPDTVTRTFTRTLACVLTDEELLEKGAKLAKLHGDVDVLEIDKKAAADTFKRKIDHMLGEAHEIAFVIRAKAEPREVSCFEEKDFERGTVRIIRADTKEVVEARAMTAQERQKTISFDHTSNDGDGAGDEPPLFGDA